MSVIADLEYNPQSVSEADVCAICDFALAEAGAPAESEISLTFVDDDEIGRLNEEYRAKPGPTDVLSFECDNLDDGFPGKEEGLSNVLGDIVIAPDVALRQSSRYGNTFEEEIELLCVHGVLHLLGYDHIEDEDAEEMESLQTSILMKWRKGEKGDAE